MYSPISLQFLCRHEAGQCEIRKWTGIRYIQLDIFQVSDRLHNIRCYTGIHCVYSGVSDIREVCVNRV